MRNRGLIIVPLAALFAAACAGGKAESRGAASGAPAAGGSGPAAVEAGRAVDVEPDVRDLSARAVPELKTASFAYDSARLDEDARGVLRANADWLKAHSGLKIQVAGHCDQRGTTAYNLALGQRRAAAVRDYYRALGVEGGRIATISYGKERPLCAEMEESCWSRNRRAETLEEASLKVAGSAR